MAAAVAALAGATALPGPAAATSSSTDEVRDMYGFPVKAEFQDLYQRFAPIYAAEEEERSARWREFLEELDGLLPSLPGEDEAALLSRLLERLAEASSSGSRSDATGDGDRNSPGSNREDVLAQPPLPPPAQAAALLQRLASLVQAGLPMAKRGVFWHLFLNVDAKRQEGEYARLVAEVEAHELELQASGGGGGHTVTPLPGAAKMVAATAMAGSGHQPYCGPYTMPGVFNLVADASSGSAAATADQVPPSLQLVCVDTFSIAPLDDDSPGVSQDEQGTGGSASGTSCEEEEEGQLTPPPPCCLGRPPAAALTPASTLQTPLSSSSGDSAGPGPGSAGSGDGSGPPSTGASSMAHTTDRWRQQDYLAQIDKDLHRTFPGHPSMDAAGRAMLRRILSAYAHRSPAVGYCQGLNFLGATFLLFMPEEDAFWCLCALVEDILGEEYFDEHMVPVQVDVLVFGHLLQGRFPTLAKHLEALDVDAASVTMHWFLCCFLNSLPLDSTLRVWDQLFFEGSPVVLFRVALALVEIYDQALMCTRDSSDAYVLLQVCAQMTFDGSRLIDTAACGYSHLKPAGLQVLRSRYQPEVMQNMRSFFPAHEELTSTAAAQSGGNGGGRSSPRTSFAARFRRLSSALLEAEEAVLRQHYQRQAGGSTDSGHLSPAQRSSSSSLASSWQSSPSSSGSQPASPLLRMQRAMRGLTSRLMPSALPVLLPAGAMSATGQELDPMAGSSTGRRPAVLSAAAAAAARQPPRSTGGELASARGAEAQKPALGLRRISVGERGGASSTTASLGMPASCSTGASLGRLADDPSRHLTPFSQVDALLEASRQQQQQQQKGGLPSAVSSPQRPRLGTCELPGRPSAGVLSPSGLADAAAQSQPATPTASHLLDGVQPLASQRRAMTAGHPDDSSQGHGRRRRRLTIDLHGLANVRPDLQQPAVAAGYLRAFAIAANPSPRAPGACSNGGTGCSVAGLSVPAASSLAPAEGIASAGGDAGCSCDQELLLPIRALQFDEQEGGNPVGKRAMRRSLTAPPAALLIAEPGQEEGLGVQQCTVDDGPAPSGDAAAADDSPVPCGPVGCSGSSNSRGCTPQLDVAQLASAVHSPIGLGHGRPQQVQAPALLPVVIQLQEEVAVAESRRHEAEQEAAAQEQMVADLQWQLRKVEKLVARKKGLVTELTSKLEACSAAILELGGEISARQLAVEAEEAAQERRRRQLVAADALIQRLMDAVAQMQAQAARGAGSSKSGGSSGAASALGSGYGSGCNSAAASLASAGGVSTACACAGSPQSSIGSVASRWASGGGTGGDTPMHSTLT